MATHTYTTNLRCSACLDAVRPHLDAVPGIASWSADLTGPEKRLTVEGDAVSPAAVREALGRAGYQVLAEVTEAAPAAPADKPPSYYPLVLILAYLIGVTAAFELAAGTFDAGRPMRHFMAGFFLVFSFFKLLDPAGFAESFAMYDVVAARWQFYGRLYPFIELALGVLYLVYPWPVAINLATLVVTGVGSVGVARTMLSGRKMRCACLGTVINLPVASVTLIEDAGMAAMALVMLARHI